MTLSNPEQTLARLRRNGWAPVPWAHHPLVVRELIRDAGFRPKVKDCYSNCGKLLLACLDTEYERDFLYCEGRFHRHDIMGVPHAWLRYRGELTDLTIVDRAGRYEQLLELTPEQFAERCNEAGRFGPFVPPDPRLESVAAFNRVLSACLRIS